MSIQHRSTTPTNCQCRTTIFKVRPSQIRSQISRGVTGVMVDQGGPRYTVELFVIQWVLMSVQGRCAVTTY
ncbi:MAG: hypothetical protein E6J34_18235 [Chloroflexi bacterium]|nr:MAG: hypothetical protein E6J34_18235 [Chloroflexota bacterium]